MFRSSSIVSRDHPFSPRQGILCWKYISISPRLYISYYEFYTLLFCKSNAKRRGVLFTQFLAGCAHGSTERGGRGGGGGRERASERRGELERRGRASTQANQFQQSDIYCEKDTTLGKQQIQYKVSLTYFIQKQPQVGIDINNSTLLIGVQLGGLYVIKHHIHSVKSFHHKRIDLKKVKRLSEYSANGNKTSLRAFLLKGNKLLYFP